MRDAFYCQPSTVLVQCYDYGVAKDVAAGIKGWYDDNGAVPIIMDKEAVSPKKNIGHLNFNICPF